jgi:hypothetical protein
MGSGRLGIAGGGKKASKAGFLRARFRKDRLAKVQDLKFRSTSDDIYLCPQS